MAWKSLTPAGAAALLATLIGCNEGPSPPRFTPAPAAGPAADRRPMPADPGGDARPARNIATH